MGKYFSFKKVFVIVFSLVYNYYNSGDADEMGN